MLMFLNNLEEKAANVQAAQIIGKTIAEKAKDKGLLKVKSSLIVVVIHIME